MSAADACSVPSLDHALSAGKSPVVTADTRAFAVLELVTQVHLHINTTPRYDHPIGAYSLAPFLSYPENNIAYLGPRFRTTPSYDHPPPSLSVPADWVGAYWISERGTVATPEDAVAAAKLEGRNVAIGGKDGWSPSTWDVRCCVSAGSMCPTVHPQNAECIPIWVNCPGTDPSALDLLNRISTPLPFLHYDLPSTAHDVVESRVRGQIPPYMWRSSIRCQCCIDNDRPCLHLSSGRPTGHGIPLKCGHCVLDKKDCLFPVITSPQQGSDIPPTSETLVPIYAQFLPPPTSSSTTTTPKPLFHLSHVWYEGIDKVASGQRLLHGSSSDGNMVRSIGGVELDEHGRQHRRDTTEKKRKVDAETEEVGIDDTQRRRLDAASSLDGLAVLPGDSIDLLLQRESLLRRRRPLANPDHPSSLPLLDITIPLPEASDDQVDPLTMSLDDLPGIGHAVVADLALVTVHPGDASIKRPATVHIQLRGDHCTIREVAEAFPRGIAAREAYSSRSFDQYLLQRIPQSSTVIRPSPSSRMVSFLADSTNAITTTLDSGFDDVSQASALTGMLANIDPTKGTRPYRTLLDSLRSTQPNILSTPAVLACLALPAPVIFTSTHFEGDAVTDDLEDPLHMTLLGIDHELKAIPTTILQDVTASTGYASDYMRSLVHRLAHGRARISGYQVEVVDFGVGSDDFLSRLDRWIPSLPAENCRMIVGFMVQQSEHLESRYGLKADDLDAEGLHVYAAWHALMGDSKLFIYDIAANKQLDRERCQKDFHILLKRYRQATGGSDGPTWKFAYERLIPLDEGTCSGPVSALLLHFILHNPKLARRGLDMVDVEEISPPVECIPLTWNNSRWLDNVVQSHRKLVLGPVTSDLLEALRKEAIARLERLPGT